MFVFNVQTIAGCSSELAISCWMCVSNSDGSEFTKHKESCQDAPCVGGWVGGRVWWVGGFVSGRTVGCVGLTIVKSQTF